MGKNKEPEFTYIAGKATCTTVDRLGRKFYGEAKCHRADHRYESELIGCTIAEMRANIEALRAYRNDCRIRLEALQQLHYSMNQSKQFNPQSYENKMVCRQIRLAQEDLSAAKEQFSLAKSDLKQYLKNKDELHKKMARRKK